MPRTNTYGDILKQIEALKQKADMVRKKEATGVIARIVEAIRIYKLTPADLGFTGQIDAETAKVFKPKGVVVKKVTTSKRGGKGRPKAIKYADGNGNTWSGAGRMVNWMKAAIEAGAKKDDFLVHKDQKAA